MRNFLLLVKLANGPKDALSDRVEITSARIMYIEDATAEIKVCNTADSFD